MLVLQSKVESLDNVQILRALAALLVVVGHSIAYVFAQVAKVDPSFAQDTGPIPWASGVDLFFVISGFIITYASGVSFGDHRRVVPFISRRAFRILPLYWLLATLWLPVLAASGKAPGLGQLIASYALFPIDAMGDGRIGPFFGLGWTLEYEMFFYLIFALLLSFSRRRGLIALVAILVSLVVLGSWVNSATRLSTTGPGRCCWSSSPASCWRSCMAGA